MRGDVIDKRCFAGALVLLAAVAGCGGDDSGDAAPATSAAAASSTTAAASTTASSAAAASTTAAGGGGAPAQPTCQPVGNLAQAQTTLAYELNEFSFKGPTAAPTGNLGFQLTNVGRAPHELAIFKGESYDAMPKNQYGTVEVAQLPAGTVIGEVDRFPGGGQTCSACSTSTPASTF